MRMVDAENPENRLFVSDFVIEQMKKIPTVEIDRPTRSQFKRMAAQLGYEPVTYCKDCVHYCECVCDYHAAAVCADWFCWNGERKNDFVDDNKIGERRTDEQ